MLKLILNSFWRKLRQMHLKDNRELRSLAWVTPRKPLTPRERREWKDSNWSNRVVLPVSLRPNASSMRKRRSKPQGSQDLAIQELMLRKKMVKVMTNVALSSLL